MIKKWMAVTTAAVWLSGCIHSEPAEKSEEQKKVSPLTGIESADIDHRALAVVVSNHSAARPQTSLKEADLVYEVLAEGGITRFLAVYQSEYPEMIGPVRSARDYFIDLAQGYNAIFLAHGYSPEAKELLLSGNMDQLNGIQYEGKVFIRENSRKAPHNSYVDVEKALAAAEQKNYDLSTAPSRLSFLSEEAEKLVRGDSALSMTISPSKNREYEAIYEYNGDAYVRSLDGETVRADNIFIIEAAHRVVDAKGRLDIDLTAGGDALLIQNGVMNPVKWRNQNGRIIPSKERGAAFVPGKTWIHVVPASKGLNKAVSVEVDEEGKES